MKSIKELRNELNESKKNKTLGKGGPGYSTVSPSMVKDIISRYKKGKLDKIPITLVRFIEFANLSMSRLKPIEQDRIDSLVTAGIVDRKQGRYVLSKDVKKIIGESKEEDIADLKALLKNPDPKVAKNYGGIEGYKKMIQSKIDRLMKEETEESVELDEAMSRAERIKRSKIMRRLQPKIKRAKERAAKKKASSDVIDKRAEKQAKEVLIKKWLKGKSKSDVPFAERERIEDKLKKSKKAVDKIKKKLVKDIRKQEAEKFTKKESTDIIEGFEVGDTVNIKSFSAKTNRDGVAEVKIVDITKTVSGKLYVHYKQDGKVKKMDYKIFKQKIR